MGRVQPENSTRVWCMEHTPSSYWLDKKMELKGENRVRFPVPE
jgi:hypothetical protein